MHLLRTHCILARQPQLRDENRGETEYAGENDHDDCTDAHRYCPLVRRNYPAVVSNKSCRDASNFLNLFKSLIHAESRMKTHAKRQMNAHAFRALNGGFAAPVW
jgi:hypothetical protein